MWRKKIIKRAKSNSTNRCLQHHVFSDKCLVKLLGYVGCDVIEIMEFSGNWLIIGSKLGKEG